MSTWLDRSVPVFDVAVLVFREGLECILVLAAITANLKEPRQRLRRPVAFGAAIGLLATAMTWLAAIHILNDLSQNVSALDLQAATGLLAIVVLLLVMNWFFHRTYWTGWISLHNQRKRALLASENEQNVVRLLVGFCLLGFSSVYREGFEVVLFLQSYRLRMDNETVLRGALVGVILTVVTGVLTFVAQRKLPYKRMLVVTGILLSVVLFVMVGEQIQEMQLAHWIPATNVPWLAEYLPDWTGVWLSIFPNVQSLAAQTVALALVFGSYVLARERGAAASTTHP